MAMTNPMRRVPGRQACTRLRLWTEEEVDEVADVLPFEMVGKQLKSYRWKLWERRPFCHFCGHRIRKFSRTTLDHLLPKSRGGGNTPENLVLACGVCNGIKGDRTPLEWARDIVEGAEPMVFVPPVIEEGGVE